MALGWSTFRIWQFVGFVALAAGTLLYNRIVEIHALFRYPLLLVVATSPGKGDLGSNVNKATGWCAAGSALDDGTSAQRKGSAECDHESTDLDAQDRRPLLASREDAYR